MHKHKNSGCGCRYQDTSAGWWAREKKKPMHNIKYIEKLLAKSTTWAKYANKMAFSCMKQSFYTVCATLLCWMEAVAKRVTLNDSKCEQNNKQPLHQRMSWAGVHHIRSMFCLCSVAFVPCARLYLPIRPTLYTAITKNLRLTKYSVEYLSVISLALTPTLWISHL